MRSRTAAYYANHLALFDGGVGSHVGWVDQFTHLPRLARHDSGPTCGLGVVIEEPCERAATKRLAA